MRPRKMNGPSGGAESRVWIRGGLADGYAHRRGLVIVVVDDEPVPVTNYRAPVTSWESAPDALLRNRPHCSMWR